MYPPFALNGLKTRPGFPGTGLATGNCAAAVVDEAGLLSAGRGVALADGLAVLREATFRGVGDGAGSGCPGFVTSDAFGTGVGSGPLKT